MCGWKTVVSNIRAELQELCGLTDEQAAWFFGDDYSFNEELGILLVKKMGKLKDENDRLQELLEPFAKVYRDYIRTNQSATSNTMLSAPVMAFYIAWNALQYDKEEEHAS